MPGLSVGTSHSVWQSKHPRQQNVDEKMSLLRENCEGFQDEEEKDVSVIVCRDGHFAFGIPVLLM
jgi:hypothetical protein